MGEHSTLQDMSILQTCPFSSTAGQQSGGSAAAVDDQLDLGVHEESEHEPGVTVYVAPGAEVLDSNDDMDEDNEIKSL